MDGELDWTLVREVAILAAKDGAPQFCSFAVTTGDAITTETVGTVTTNQVMVWLDGVAQTVANKRTVVLLYGQTAPAAGQVWLVLWPNYAPPGVLLGRTSQ